MTPKVFMSDMAEAFYNAWSKEMGSAKLRLFCTWHVDCAWRKNLKKKKDKEKQLEVYKVCRTLLQERDVDTFKILLELALSYLNENNDLKEFGNYFTSYYAKNTKLWAYCYRLHSGLNTNMHIERLHRTIKYIYLQGKQVKRLDKTINALMKFIRDKLIDRLIVYHKGKVATKLQEIRKRHKTAVLMETEIIRNADRWSIPSSNKNELYDITELNTSCKCKLLCVECNSCIHKYTCTCHDTAIRWNMCKHIHFICLKNKSSLHENIHKDGSDDQDCDLTIVSPDDEAENIFQALKEKKPLLSITKRQSKLKKEYLDLISSSNEESLEIMEANLKSLKSTLDAVNLKKANISSSFNLLDKNSLPSNKKVIPQRLYSVKKKKKNAPKYSISKPSDDECNKTALLLIQNAKNTS